ncbi:hypothetical protein LDENG_00006150 [Lucifuga dentata]|nr:hypothetical protein LDENG_00006150 [Lucifuga dentata]
MCALTPNRRTRFMSTSSHQSDSPQVQCVQSFSSQEPDELSIEMADVLNLLERTDDGAQHTSANTELLHRVTAALQLRDQAVWPPTHTYTLTHTHLQVLVFHCFIEAEKSITHKSNLNI